MKINLLILVVSIILAGEVKADDKIDTNDFQCWQVRNDVNTPLIHYRFVKEGDYIKSVIKNDAVNQEDYKIISFEGDDFFSFYNYSYRGGNLYVAFWTINLAAGVFYFHSSETYFFHKNPMNDQLERSQTFSGFCK